MDEYSIVDEYSIDRLNNILKSDYTEDEISTMSRNYTDDEIRTMSRKKKIDKVKYIVYYVDRYLKNVHKYTDDELTQMTPEEKIILKTDSQKNAREDKANRYKKKIYISYPIGFIISLAFVFWSYKLHKYWGIFVLLCYMIFFTRCFIANILIPSSKKNWDPPLGFGAGYAGPLEGKIRMDNFCSTQGGVLVILVTIFGLTPINIFGTAYKSYTQ